VRELKKVSIHYGQKNGRGYSKGKKVATREEDGGDVVKGKL
jgi:hypothetical protein